MADVYFHFDADNRLLYVGITARQFQRQYEHAQTKSWWAEVARVECWHLEDQEKAAEVEATMIRIFSPRYNKQHNSKKRRLTIEPEWLEWDDQWKTSTRDSVSRSGTEFACSPANSASLTGSKTSVAMIRRRSSWLSTTIEKRVSRSSVGQSARARDAAGIMPLVSSVRCP